MPKTKKGRPPKTSRSTLVAVKLDDETMAALLKLEAAVDPDVAQPRPIAIRRAIKVAAAALDGVK